MNKITDMLGNELSVDDYLAYALVAGRSANMGIYQIIEIKDTGSLKVRPVKRSYGGYGVPAKSSTVAMVNTRGILLKDFVEVPQ